MQINTVLFAVAALFVSASVTENPVVDKTVVEPPKCTAIERYGSYGNRCGGCRQDWHFVDNSNECDLEHECCRGYCCPNMMTIQEQDY